MDHTTLNSTGTTTSIDQWSTPERIQVNELSDSIEMIYKQKSMLTYTVFPTPPPEEQVFKIVFSCKEGKWCKSDRIYGEIVPSRRESYEFND